MPQRKFLETRSKTTARKTWHFQIAQILAEQLGCELVTLPGHHAGFSVFAPAALLEGEMDASSACKRGDRMLP